MTSNYALLRINAPSEYKTFDTSENLNGNPINNLVNNVFRLVL